MAGDATRSGEGDVQCGDEPVELENPGGLPLVLASSEDVKAGKSAVRLPPDALAVLSEEDHG